MKMGRKKKEVANEEIIVEQITKKKFDIIKVGDLFLCEFKQCKYVIEIQWEKNKHYWLHFQYLKNKTSKGKKGEESYGFIATVQSACNLIEKKAYEKISKSQYKKYLAEGI